MEQVEVAVISPLGDRTLLNASAVLNFYRQSIFSSAEPAATMPLSSV
jgi:hypothetical protein